MTTAQKHAREQVDKAQKQITEELHAFLQQVKASIEVHTKKSGQSNRRFDYDANDWADYFTTGAGGATLRRLATAQTKLDAEARVLDYLKIHERSKEDELQKEI